MAQTTRRFQFLLLDEFSSAGLYLMTEPLFLANWLLGRDAYSWTILSLDGSPARSSSAMIHPVDGSMDDCRMDAPLFVLASFNGKALTGDRKLLALLRRLGRHGVLLGGIETGGEALAKAGLLNGYRAAVHWDNKIGFQEQFPDIDVTESGYEVDRSRITSVGGLSNLHLALHLIGEAHGSDLAAEVGRHLLVIPPGGAAPDLHGGTQRVREQSGSSRVRRATMLMKADLENPISCQDIADRLSISLRQLERDFLAHYGLTPKKYYKVLRLNHAHSLLQQTNLSVTEISVSAGFASSEHFSRAYRAQFGCPPSQDRRQVTDAPTSWTPDHVAGLLGTRH
ncbi:MAG: GlxA family transcriptional regulator [Alphaproteobacteria bacterium]